MESSKSKSSIVLNNLSTALLRQLNGIMSSISEFSELVISDKEITLLDSSLYRPFISLLLKSFPPYQNQVQHMVAHRLLK